MKTIDFILYPSSDDTWSRNFSVALYRHDTIYRHVPSLRSLFFPIDFDIHILCIHVFKKLCTTTTTTTHLTIRRLVYMSKEMEENSVCVCVC